MKFLSMLLIICLTIVACKKEEIIEPESIAFCELVHIEDYPCGPSVIEDSLRYDSISNNSFSITNVEVTDNCLSFDLSASGCDGNSWLVNVIDAQTIAYTNPLSKNLKIEFTNNEVCTAVPTKSYYFDLFPLQETTDTIINLNIQNAGISILYSY